MMKFLAKTANDLYLDTSIIDTCHGSKYASEPKMQYLLYKTDDNTAVPSSEIHVRSTIWKT